jgi:hypothetical protein
MRKLLRRPVAAPLFFSAFLSVLLLQHQSRAHAADPKPVKKEASQIGTVHQVTGKAWATRDASAVRKTELHAHSPLYDGDILLTDKSSELTVVLGNKEAALLVKQNSMMKVVHTENKDWLIDLKQGLSLFNVNQKNIRPGFFRVKTNAAVMGVRGTAFFVKVETGKNVFLCACFGTVTVDDDVVFKSTHHDFHKFIKAGTAKTADRLIDADMGSEHSDTEAGVLIKLLEWDESIIPTPPSQPAVDSLPAQSGN